MGVRSDRGFRFPKDKYADPLALYENFRYLEGYLDYIRKRDFYGTTVIVASSTSDNPFSAHHIADGANDQVEIQAAIDSLPAAGGEVVLLEGTYDITERIELPVKNVVLRGVGATLDVANNISGHIINGAALGTYHIENFKLTGGTIGKGIIGGEGFFFVFGNRFDTISCDYIMGSKGVSQNTRWIVVGNHFIDVDLNWGSINAERSALLIADAGGSRYAEGVFANNFCKNITITDFAGNEHSLVYASGLDRPIICTGNIIENSTTLEAYFSGSGAIASHNIVDGVMVAGDHTGTDHGTLSGLADEDHPAYIAKSFIGAKGDLIGASADNTPLILTVGTDGQILYSDSGTATGLLWDDAPTGGGGSDGDQAWRGTFMLGGM